MIAVMNRDIKVDTAAIDGGALRMDPTVQSAPESALGNAVAKQAVRAIGWNGDMCTTVPVPVLSSQGITA